MKKTIELLLMLVIGVPMMLLGYLGTFAINGLITGNRLHATLHAAEDEK